MRKIFLFMMVSLDGYFEGENHDLSWHNAGNQEFNDFANSQLDYEIDTIIFGHRTYDMMASFWPSEHAMKDDPETAKRMNYANKIVFSKTLDKADWEHTTVMKEVDVDEINKLKAMPGKDIAIFGSSNLCLSFLEKGLLDELRIMINPVIVGKGTTLFTGIKNILNLKLMKTKTFDSGNVLIIYEPIK